VGLRRITAGLLSNRNSISKTNWG